MKQHFFTKRGLIAAAFMMLCAIQSIAGTIPVTSNITSNTTWTSDNQYLLVGLIYVTNNAILTIEPGTIIKGDSSTLGSLLITRGSKLMAIGTPSQPIVFTSAKTAGTRKRGDWGGIIILGYAPVNWPGDTGHIEGISPNPDTRYGGGLNPNCANGDCPDVNDNSGTLQYVRIEFGGIALAPNNEINGLTLGGVGAGTTIDHVQVSYSNDDSFEWFGGTVNVKYLIAYDGLDDDFDTDIGYAGKVQFGLAMREAAVADVSGSHSFESDNDPSGSANTPQTSVQFQNITALGGSSDNSSNPLMKQSAQIRRNSNLKIYNSILMGFPQGLLIDGTSTIANCASATLVANSYVQQASANYIGFTPAGDPNEAAANTNLTGNGNVYSTTYTGVLVDADFPITDADNLVPAPGNPLPAANNALYSGGFWTPVSYVGAFDPAGDTWANDWTNFNPQNEAYTGIASPQVISKTNVYPNPMKTSSTIEFNLVESNQVNIAITDVAGRTIREVMNEFLNAGSHIVTVNLRDLTTGMYFLLIRSGNDNQMIKLSVED